MRRINTIKELLKAYPEFKKPRPFIDIKQLYWAGIITPELYRKLYWIYYNYYKKLEHKHKPIKKSKKTKKSIKGKGKRKTLTKKQLLEQVRKLKRKLKSKDKGSKKRKPREVPAVNICDAPIPKDVSVPKSWSKWKSMSSIVQILERELTKENGLQSKILLHYASQKGFKDLYMNFSDKFRNLMSKCPDKVLYFHQKHIKRYNIYYLLEVKDEYEIEKYFHIDKDNKFEKFYLLGRFTFNTLRYKRLKRVKGGKVYYKKVDRWKDLYDLYWYMGVSGMTARMSYPIGNFRFHQGGTMNEAIRESLKYKKVKNEVVPNPKYNFKFILGFEPVSFYVK
jgi:hypothetical protein